MAKKKEVKTWDAAMAYTGDSANFHIYQIVDDKMVGSVYLSKAARGKDPLPNRLVVNLLNPSDPAWKLAVKTLLDKAREGSKSKAKLARILKENS